MAERGKTGASISPMDKTVSPVAVATTARPRWNDSSSCPRRTTSNRGDTSIADNRFQDQRKERMTTFLSAETSYGQQIVLFSVFYLFPSKTCKQRPHSGLLRLILISQEKSLILSYLLRLARQHRFPPSD